MFSFFKLFSNNKTDKDINIGEKYEQELYDQFGNCRKHKPFGIKVLFIIDTHNCLTPTDKNMIYIESIKPEDYDICLVLGDLSGSDINEIKRIVPDEKLFGITGNHDSKDLMELNGIKDINGKVIECKGVRIAAIMGSNKYKEGNYGMITHEESIELADSMESSDILVSHDKPYIWDRNDKVHDGLKGITKYIYKNHIPIHIHGHLHEEFEEILKNGTKSICLYQVKLMEL